MQTIRWNPRSIFIYGLQDHFSILGRVLIILWMIAGGAPVDANEPLNANPVAWADSVVQFERDIAPIIKTRCLGCHQGEKARGGFDVSVKETVMGYVESGNASASSLWTDYLIAPRVDVKESTAMPPEGPLPASDLALFKLWLDEGANWPDNVQIGQSQTSIPANAQLPQKILKALGYFHPAIVHFPIALFCVGGMVAFLSYFLGSRCLSTAFQCLVIATLSSVLSVVMGWSYAQTKGYGNWLSFPGSTASETEMTMFFHRWMGSGIAVLGILAIVIALFARRQRSSSLHNYWRLLTIFIAILTAWVGHQGGELVHGDLFHRVVEIFSN